MTNTSGNVVKAAFENLPFAVVVVNRSGEVTLWGKTAERLFGFKSSEVLGRSDPIVPSDRQDEFRAFEELVLSDKTLHVKSFRRRKDGALIELGLTLIPIHNRKGAVTAVMSVYQPVGEPLIHSDKPERASGAPRRTEPARVGVELLTRRERDVVELVLQGNTTKTIAQNIGTGEQVVRNHLHAIYRQLRVSNRAELIAALSK